MFPDIAQDASEIAAAETAMSVEATKLEPA
jgi:hypothetical protein